MALTSVLLLVATIGILLVSIAVSRTATKNRNDPGTTMRTIQEAKPTIVPIVMQSAAPLAAGKQIYAIKSSTKGPQITAASFYPLDAPVNSKQTITATVSFSKAITSVVAEIITEAGSKSTPLTLTDGSATDGTWSGSWTVTLPHRKLYGAKFTAKSNDGPMTTVDLWFR